MVKRLHYYCSLSVQRQQTKAIRWYYSCTVLGNTIASAMVLTSFIEILMQTGRHHLDSWSFATFAMTISISSSRDLAWHANAGPFTRRLLPWLFNEDTGCGLWVCDKLTVNSVQNCWIIDHSLMFIVDHSLIFIVDHSLMFIIVHSLDVYKTYLFLKCFTRDFIMVLLQITHKTLGQIKIVLLVECLPLFE